MGKHDFTQQTDAGCRGMKIYFQMLPLVQYHFDSYVFMDMMFLQVFLKLGSLVFMTLFWQKLYNWIVLFCRSIKSIFRRSFLQFPWRISEGHWCCIRTFQGFRSHHTSRWISSRKTKLLDKSFPETGIIKELNSGS